MFKASFNSEKTQQDTYEKKTLTIEEVIKLSDRERIEYVYRDRFVIYPRAKEVLEKLEELKNVADSIRPDSFLIVGPPNNGKTAIVSYFNKKNPPYEDPEGVKIPVLYLQAPFKPDINMFFDSILEQIDPAFRKTDSLSTKLIKIKHYLREYDTKVVIIDEIHNVLAGSKTKHREFMNALKNLTNDLKRPFVLVGTKDALLATDTDYQISSRFPPYYLPTWSYDDNFLSFLKTYETTLPLRKESKLVEQEELAMKILEYSEGYLGEIVSILKKLTILAIKTKREKIDSSLLKQLQWIPPSKRREIGTYKL
ncbi:MAG: hypothetical protein PWQ78_627 [Petrotoga sp.]|nr:hypothetical protein [Petrotoga sp.]